MSEDIALTETIIPETNNLSIEQLNDMIAKLSITEQGEPLKNEMSKLKIALKQNPAACSMLLPEQIGEMVAALRKITGRGILDQLNPEIKKEKKASSKIIVTAEDIANATLDDLL